MRSSTTSIVVLTTFLFLNSPAFAADLCITPDVLEGFARAKLITFMRNLIVSFGVITGVSISVSGQGWRGIVPLKSDCETVKGSLEIPQCRTGAYQFSEGSIIRQLL